VHNPKRPKKVTVTITVRFTPALKADLEEYASRDRRTVTNLIAKICEDFIAAERAKAPQQ
jgi:hypothetical protein